MNHTVLLIILLLLFASNLFAQNNKKALTTNVCYRWQTQVDMSKARISIDNGKLTIAEIEEGIGCLLKLKGNKYKARFTGTTGFDPHSSNEYKPPRKPATVEIAALYYASYLFYDNWEHAGSVALYDEDTEEINTKNNIERAYKSYRKWLAKIKEIGFEKAREQKLDPLEGSGINWS